jgi:DNA-binding NtrC family response regulator
MRQLFERIRAVAATRSTALIVGESGVGKELVARAIHACSREADRPFVAFNCAALPRELVESELFGYQRGAFSGAVSQYLGLFRSADGGTLLLDEITEMKTETQGKLLRAIQERTVRPVGSTGEIAVDVRVIASSNRDLGAALRANLLRQDLYYRLQVNVLKVPPLRERREDIPLLANHFTALLNERLGRRSPIAGIERAALDALVAHEWPGNVREFGNALESAFTFGPGPNIRLEDLPTAVAQRSPSQVEPGWRAHPQICTLAEAEQELIRRTLERTKGNKLRAARLLCISRKKLYAKIEKYRLVEFLPGPAHGSVRRPALEDALT